VAAPLLPLPVQGRPLPLPPRLRRALALLLRLLPRLLQPGTGLLPPLHGLTGIAEPPARFQTPCSGFAGSP
jgi:hypothetical protein